MKAEAVTELTPGYWQVWIPDDERKRTGAKLAGPMSRAEALSYARGWNDAMKAIASLNPAQEKE